MPSITFLIRKFWNASEEVFTMLRLEKCHRYWRWKGIASFAIVVSSTGTSRPVRPLFERTCKTCSRYTSGYVLRSEASLDLLKNYMNYCRIISSKKIKEVCRSEQIPVDRPHLFGVGSIITCLWRTATGRRCTWKAVSHLRTRKLPCTIITSLRTMLHSWMWLCWGKWCPTLATITCTVTRVVGLLKSPGSTGCGCQFIRRLRITGSMSMCKWRIRFGFYSY